MFRLDSGSFTCHALPLTLPFPTFYLPPPGHALFIACFAMDFPFSWWEGTLAKADRTVVGRGLPSTPPSPPYAPTTFLPAHWASGWLGQLVGGRGRTCAMTVA